jgi:hypothetical protein
MAYSGRNTEKIRKHRVICFLMMVCFAVSYLPVTTHWYVGFSDRENLTFLVTAMVGLKMDTENRESVKSVNQSMDTLFKELKIAAGIVQPDPLPEKGKVTLVEIVPEFPVHPALFRLRMDKKRLYGLSDHEKHYQSVLASLDPPPPAHRFV